MSTPRQTRLVELQRRIRNAVEALRAVDNYLARELGPGASSPDQLAERIENATKAAISRGKDH